MPELELDFGVSAAVNGAIQIAVVITAAVALVVVGRWLIPRLIATRMPLPRQESPGAGDARAKTISKAVVGVFTIAVWLLSATMVLGQLGVNIGPLLAGIGVGALALGFAAQNIIRDYLNGLFILMEDWYRIGDWVSAGGVEGEVEQVGLRRTALREINGTLHSIPNSQIPFASNQTRDWARINLSVTVAYKEDLSRVYAVIDGLCQELRDDPAWGNDLTTTPSAIRVGELGDHGVGIGTRGFTKPGMQWGLTGELRKRIKNRFDEEHIEIPWPHTKVYFGNAPVNSG